MKILFSRAVDNLPVVFEWAEQGRRDSGPMDGIGMRLIYLLDEPKLS